MKSNGKSFHLKYFFQEIKKEILNFIIFFLFSHIRIFLNILNYFLKYYYKNTSEKDFNSICAIQ